MATIRQVQEENLCFLKFLFYAVYVGMLITLHYSVFRNLQNKSFAFQLYVIIVDSHSEEKFAVVLPVYFHIKVKLFHKITNSSSDGTFNFLSHFYGINNMLQFFLGPTGFAQVKPVNPFGFRIIHQIFLKMALNRCKGWQYKLTCPNSLKFYKLLTTQWTSRM